MPDLVLSIPAGSAGMSIVESMRFPGRLALLVDGPSLHASANALGFEVDFKRLLEHFTQRGSIVRASYFSTFATVGEAPFKRPLLKWLGYNGFRVVEKAVHEQIQHDDQPKNPIGTELAVDAMEIVDRVDELVIFADDGDYQPLLAALQRKGLRVVVVSSGKTQRCRISSSLRRQADEFIELAELSRAIGRQPHPGEPKPMARRA